MKPRNPYQLPTVNVPRKPAPAIDKAPWIGFDHAEPGSDHTVYSFSVPDVGLPLSNLWRQLKTMVINELVEQHNIRRDLICDEWLKRHVVFSIKHDKPGGVNILSYDNGINQCSPIMAFVEPTLKTEEGKTFATLRARAMLPNGEYK